MKSISKGLRILQYIRIIGLLLVLSAGLFLASPIAQAFTFTTINVPSSIFTQPNGINPSGEIVGFFIESAAIALFHGFLLDKNGTFTTIDVPGAFGTEAFGINPSGQIVGFFEDASDVFHGFLLDKNGNFTIIDHPPGSIFTQANGINPSGEIAGSPGFSRDKKGNFTPIGISGSIFTQANGINPSGEIVGLFEDSNFGEHGFLAVP